MCDLAFKQDYLSNQAIGEASLKTDYVVINPKPNGYSVHKH